MIKDFAVENFLSFKDRQEISFEATADTMAEDNLIYKVVHPKTGVTTRILRVNVIYGANASGKTNILLALQEVFSMLITCKRDKSDGVRHIPFALHKDNRTRFEVSFFFNDIEYQYKIEYDSKIIYSESLRFNPNGAMSLFYKRDYDAEKNLPQISFGENAEVDTKAKKTIIENTFNNHTVLSTFDKVVFYAPLIEQLYNWINAEIYSDMNGNDANIVSKASDAIVDMMSDPIKRSFLFDYINTADFNIDDIQYEVRNIPLPEEVRGAIIANDDLTEEQKAQLVSGKRVINVNVEHSSDEEKFILPLTLESKGTLKTIEFSKKFYDIITSSSVFLNDEMGSAIHHELFVYFIQKFVVNEHKSQIIFTTHNQMLLDESFMRRDMVWFVQKDSKTMGSEIYSAADFRLHKNVSLLNAYKVGKFGAQPEVGSPFVNLDMQ
ncbi:MAG: ATP-binding protein [Rikenellaceae bacterium]